MRDDISPMCESQGSEKFMGRRQKKTIQVDRMRKLLALSIDMVEVLRKHEIEEHEVGVVMGYLDSQLRGV